MSNPNPQLSVTDMNRFMNMTQADLQAEVNAQAAITAQLKTDEAAMLQDRLDLRARLTTPPAPDDAEVRDNVARITGNIADNEREIAYSEAVEKLLRRLLPTPTTSSTPMTSSTPTTATTSSTTGTPTGSTTSTTTTTTSTMQYRQILGKIPEYKLADDFDIFLSRFETYCSLNRISDEQQTKLLLDSAFSEEAKLRASEISALCEPYKSESFTTYSQRLRDRFYPQAKSTLYKNSYDSIKQGATQSVTDYCSKKFASYRKAYHGYPFQFLVRTLVQGLHNEDLRSEVLRSASDLESSIETNSVRQQRLYGELMNVINGALDLCRRVGTSSTTTEAMDRNGLRVEGSTPVTTTSTASSSSVAQIGDNEDFYDNYQYEEEEEIYAADEETEEVSLTEEEIHYCFLNESEAQSQYWERQATEEEIHQMQTSPTGKRCHECNSPLHLVRQCPIRLRLVQSRTNKMLTQSGRSPYSPYPANRGGYRPRFNRGAQGRGGGGGGRGGRGPGRGRGGGGGGGFAPPPAFQNLYQPGQPASRMGPAGGFPGSRYFR